MVMLEPKRLPKYTGTAVGSVHDTGFLSSKVNHRWT
tara:strand:- start:71 stop:178 length:108 start_codon:yes stop_codon:yes gene_type:complete